MLFSIKNIIGKDENDSIRKINNAGLRKQTDFTSIFIRNEQKCYAAKAFKTYSFNDLISF